MKKRFCRECIHLKYVDDEGYGYCDLWEEMDVKGEDEACVEFFESESEQEFEEL